MLVQSSFQGISHAQELALDPTQTAQAPDLDLAVSPTEVVEVTNSVLSIWNPDGTPRAGAADLKTFFQAPNGLSNISIMYDRSLDRFLMSAATASGTASTSLIWLAVSNTNEAEGSWTVDSFNAFDPSNPLGSAPQTFANVTIGISADKAVVTYTATSQMNQGRFPFPVVFVLDQTALTQSQAIADRFTWPNVTNSSEVFPVVDATPTNDLYIVTPPFGEGQQGNCVIDNKFAVITGSVSGGLSVGVADSSYPSNDQLGHGQCGPTPTVAQAGSPTTLSSSPTAGVRGVWQNGTVWSFATVPCTWPPGGTSNPQQLCQMSQQFYVGGPHAFAFTGVQPAAIEVMQVLGAGNTAADWWGTSGTTDPRGNVYFAGYNTAGGASPSLGVTASEVGTSQYSDTITINAASSQVVDTSQATVPYGTSSTLVSDPLNPLAFWLAGEVYLTGSQSDPNQLPWGTAIVKIDAPNITLTDSGEHNYTIDGWGGIHANAGSPPLTCSGYWPGWDIARGMSLDKLAEGGYEVDGWGGVHPCGNSPPVTSDNSYWPGWDIARGITTTLTGDGGYVLDGWGGVHGFGNVGNMSCPYFPGRDIARGLALQPSGGGAYILLVDGDVLPCNGAPALPLSVLLPSNDPARGFVLLNDGSGGYVLDSWGGVYPFGAAPDVGGGPRWPGWSVARGISLWTNSTDAFPGGWIVDAFGGVHPFGYANDVDSGAYWRGWDIARGLSGVNTGV